MQNLKWNDLSAETGSILRSPNKTVIKNHLKAIIGRLNSVDNENFEDIEILPCESSTKWQSNNQTYKEKL